MGNISKFYAWLEHNKNTPLKTKLLVFYNCVFAALLYGVETWWKVESYKENLLQIERKTLKSCLGVKNNTPNNLLYVELNRADIIPTIQDRQYHFFRKTDSLLNADAFVKNVIDLCKDLEIIRYYKQLSNTNKLDSIANRKLRVLNCNDSLMKRFRDLTQTRYLPSLYDCYMNEELRTIVTRWRFSCHDLAIETGRYTGIVRHERLCCLCDVIEDETHAIFECKAFTEVREQFKD